MQLKICAVCGIESGTRIGTATAEMTQVMLVPATRMGSYNKSDGEVTLCSLCRDGLPFNIDDFNRSVTDQAQELTSHRDLFSRFVKAYIGDVWDGPKPPTYYNIMDALNLAGIKTINGFPWEYHNLMQYMHKCGLKRDQLLKRRMDVITSDSTGQDMIDMARKVKEQMDGHIDPMDEVNKAIEANTERIMESRYGVLPRGLPGESRDR